MPHASTRPAAQHSPSQSTDGFLVPSAVGQHLPFLSSTSYVQQLSLMSRVPDAQVLVSTAHSGPPHVPAHVHWSVARSQMPWPEQPELRDGSSQKAVVGGQACVAAGLEAGHALSRDSGTSSFFDLHNV